MLEAVHRSELSLLMLALVEGESQVSGQVVIINPVIAGPPIRFGEHPTIGISSNGDAALMHRGVVPLTQQDQIANTALRVPTAVMREPALRAPLGGPGSRSHRCPGHSTDGTRRDPIITQNHPR